MKLIKSIILELIFTVFAVIVLAYVSMATAMGPWIAPAIILLMRLFHPRPATVETTTDGAVTTEEPSLLVQIAGSLGGIIAIGIGFTLPTLYFLDRQSMINLLGSPLQFSLTLGLITLAAGSLGTWLARIISPALLADENFRFPVSRLISQTACTLQDYSASLIRGIASSWGVLIARDGLFSVPALLPKTQFYLWPSKLGTLFPLSIAPTLWAIGFASGLSIALPLTFGMLSKYIVLQPLNLHSKYLSFALFQPLADEAFISAFCSGMVVFELLNSLSKIRLKTPFNSLTTYIGRFTSAILPTATTSFFERIEPWLAAILSLGLLTFLGFPILASLFLIAGTLAASYQITYFGVRTGLVPFGRFVTLFAMLPMILLFKLSAVQTTWLCVFIAICMAATSNLAFQYKVGDLNNIDRKTIYKHQWIGLILTTLVVGACFWLLLSYLQIGTAELFCQRGFSRALLVQSPSVNPFVLLFGAIFGLIITFLKMSPTMVFGGILMPNSMIIGLLIGALLSEFSFSPQKHQSFWSGVFAGEAVWTTGALLARLLH